MAKSLRFCPFVVPALIVFAAAPAAAQDPPAPAAEPPLAIAPDDASIQWGACPPIFPGDCRIAVLHGDPARPNADVLLRVGGGYVLPPHRHSSAERMILLSGRLEVRYAGAPQATLGTGHYAYGPAGLAHSGRCVSTEPCTLFIAFEGPVDAVAVDAVAD
ncbi:MAG TPA: cupin domain-containing protein [Allosphingosinicella sp.]|nr:cupin domain-containing protein [Allosphingosinicella sp.]